MIDNILSIFFVQYLSQFLKPILNTLPERAEALSPGQRPGYNGNGQGALNQRSPAHSGKVKGKSFKIHLIKMGKSSAICKAFALTGRAALAQTKTQGDALG